MQKMLYSRVVFPKLPGNAWDNTLPNDPGVFTLWKSNGREKLISFSKRFRLSLDSLAYVVDLAKGTATAGDGEGDLRLNVQELAQTDGLGRPRWAILISANDGGFADAPFHAYENEAPTDGYHVISNNESFAVGGYFYIKSRGGKVYGHIQIQCSVFDSGIDLRVQSLINPNGSRNLESWPDMVFPAGSPQAVELISAKQS